MTIAEMHVWFRQYAQQMGMQNVRAILPEQIDLLINTSIIDTVNQIIKENIGITNDRVITDNSKIGQINALSTLYKVKLIEVFPTNTSSVQENDMAAPFQFEESFRRIGKLNGIVNSNTESSKRNAIPEYLYLVDFSINYKEAELGTGFLSWDGDHANYEGPQFKRGLETNFFPVRLIDDAFLADTLNDFVLKNRLRSPIIVNYNNKFDLYIDEFKEVANGQYVLENNLLPYQLRMSYIAKPAKVRYAEDLNGKNIDCDLPDYMHVDVLKHAVDLYRIAISGSLQAARNQAQAQASEDLRNNYRNDNTQRAATTTPTT